MGAIPAAITTQRLPCKHTVEETRKQGAQTNHYFGLRRRQLP